MPPRTPHSAHRPQAESRRSRMPPAMRGADSQQPLRPRCAYYGGGDGFAPCPAPRMAHHPCAVRCALCRLLIGHVPHFAQASTGVATWSATSRQKSRRRLWTHRRTMIRRTTLLCSEGSATGCGHTRVVDGHREFRSVRHWVRMSSGGQDHPIHRVHPATPTGVRGALIAGSMLYSLGCGSALTHLKLCLRGNPQVPGRDLIDTFYFSRQRASALSHPRSSSAP